MSAKQLQVAEEPALALREAGLRVTAVRLAVLDALVERPHADAEAVELRVRERLGTVSRQAVYDVLRALTDAGLLRRVDIGRSALYEPFRGDNHHHLVCRSCGRLEDVPCAVGAAPCLDPVHDHGFAIEVAEVVYRGLCSACRNAAAVRAPECSAPA